MPKAKSARPATAKATKLRKKLIPYAQPESGPSTASAYIQAHLRSASTIRNYNSAINGARTWLELKCIKYTSLTEDRVDESELGLFRHKDACIAFEKPVEVTAHLLAKYIMFRVAEEDRSVSVVDTLRSAFKWHFRNLSVFASVSSFSGIPHLSLVIEDLKALGIHDPTLRMKNHRASEGTVRNHARAIRINDIKAMQSITAAYCSPSLIVDALNPEIPDDFFTLKQRDDIRSHLMLCALTSLGWTLNEELTSILIRHLDWGHEETAHNLRHLRVTLVNRKGWQKRNQDGEQGSQGSQYNIYPLYGRDTFSHHHDPHTIPQLDTLTIPSSPHARPVLTISAGIPLFPPLPSTISWRPMESKRIWRLTGSHPTASDVADSNTGSFSHQSSDGGRLITASGGGVGLQEKASTLLKYATDMLADVEHNYSDALAPVHIDYSESQNGAKSHLNPMTAEETRSQFGHLGTRIGYVESQLRRLDQIEAGFNTIQASLDELKYYAMGMLVPHYHPLTTRHRSPVTVTPVPRTFPFPPPHIIPPHPAPRPLNPHPPSPRQPQERRDDGRPAPGAGHITIPHVSTLEDAIKQWLCGDGNELKVPLKKWEKGWYTGRYSGVHGTKYNNRRRVGQKYDEMGEAKFLRHYGLKMTDNFGTALKAITEEGKRDGFIQSRNGKKSHRA
ncbi:uncharacterized protein EI90DRAFT_3118638 [Cantharellus anzutake]|uniref:uncharacterized protein n=1 Tax=Cantharellus anzutake TaxID=1750568 RepID=UPI00190328FB|nr:uncharacterized protein EI90DRAFT_3118638 [Cantharellus anzutake]KAF8338213.1 hypothetical protein EI90DRAFT_3118638 [Cantharellus anzutake]